MDRHKCAEFLDTVVSNTGRQSSVYRRQKRKFRRLFEAPKRCNFLFLCCRPKSYTTNISVPDLNQKEYSAGSTTPPLQECSTRMFVTGCHTAWNVRCYWKKLISQKMSSKQINTLKFADLWVVMSCKLAHVCWSSRGKCYLHHHGCYSRYTCRTSTLNIPRHVPEKEDCVAIWEDTSDQAGLWPIWDIRMRDHTHTHTHTTCI
jgi:hypothetical protein